MAGTVTSILGRRTTSVTIPMFTFLDSLRSWQLFVLALALLAVDPLMSRWKKPPA